MRYLAVDLGGKRTGLALGDAESGIVSPLGVLQIPLARGEGQELLSAVARVVEEQLAPGDQIVIGLPLNMDGSQGPQAEKTRAWGERLAALVKRQVHYQDERLTSSEADETLRELELTRRRRKETQDAVAAAVILNDFLRARPAP